MHKKAHKMFNLQEIYVSSDLAQVACFDDTKFAITLMPYQNKISLEFKSWHFTLEIHWQQADWTVSTSKQAQEN